MSPPKPPPADPAAAYKARVAAAIQEYRPTAQHQLQRERHEAEQRRRERGAPARVDLLRKTMDMLERRGYYVERTERYDAALKRRFDLFGCVDAIALGNGETLAVQATSWENVSARATKMRASKGLRAATACGWRAVVVGWRKGENGKWEHKEVRIDEDADGI
jgi:hypothetical protein